MTSAIRHAAAALLLPLAVLRAQSSQTVHRGDRYVDASVAASFYTIGGPHFSAIYGFGTEFTTISGSSIQFGWKFQHMSNGYTSPLNPGLDVNVIYLGWSRRRGG